MNCESAQQAILLRDTGELAAGQKLELRDHLAMCHDCRQYDMDTRRIADLSQQAFVSAGPSKKTIERILAAGKRKTSPGTVFMSFTTTQWLAAAAGLMVIFAITGLLVVAHDRRDVAAHGLRMTQMSTIMTMMSCEDFPLADSTTLDSAKPDVRALARQILQVEGLMEEELADDEETIPDDDARPRDLQSHSILDSRPIECV